jgi:hypothetical protein
MQPKDEAAGERAPTGGPVAEAIRSLVDALANLVADEGDMYADGGLTGYCSDGRIFATVDLGGLAPAMMRIDIFGGKAFLDCQAGDRRRIGYSAN